MSNEDNASNSGRDLATGRFLPGNKISKGARPGSLHNVKYPWRTYFKRRALRKQDRWALAIAEPYCNELIADKGGDGEVTAGERRLIEIASAARVCWMLALTKDDSKACASFMQVEQRSLVQIGLTRRAKDITNDLNRYLAGLEEQRSSENEQEAQHEPVNAVKESEQGHE